MMMRPLVTVVIKNTPSRINQKGVYQPDSRSGEYCYQETD